VKEYPWRANNAIAASSRRSRVLASGEVMA
jgi:hypothetical protein